MMTTAALQDEIIRKFRLLNGDPEMITVYLMELGKALPVMSEAEKTPYNLVSGCHSKVWMTAVLQHGKVWFKADSNAAIVRGIISLLLKILNGQPPEVILHTDLYFIRENSLRRFVGSVRAEGFQSLITKIKYRVLKLQE